MGKRVTEQRTSTIRVIHDGAVNFAYESTTYPTVTAQGDDMRMDGVDGSWRLYLVRANGETITIRTLNHDEARRMGRAWCTPTP